QAGLAVLSQGPEMVEEVMAATMASERPRYDRFLSFLGTLGSNAPFVGLFGTVLGIIKAFHDLGAVAIRGSAIQQTVMTGISEALVATAVGLAVAIPAVVAYNLFTRSLKNRVSRAQALAHALVAAARNPRTDAAAATRPVRGVVEGEPRGGDLRSGRGRGEQRGQRHRTCGHRPLGSAQRHGH